MGINCSIFLYRNPFGGNQYLALHDPEILQNCAGFTLCSSAGLAVGECHPVMGLTMHVVCTDLKCVVCIRLLFAEFSTVNTGLGTPMFWKPLCLLSTPEGLATTNYQLT